MPCLDASMMANFHRHGLLTAEQLQTVQCTPCCLTFITALYQLCHCGTAPAYMLKLCRHCIDNHLRSAAHGNFMVPRMCLYTSHKQIVCCGWAQSMKRFTIWDSQHYLQNYIRQPARDTFLLGFNWCTCEHFWVLSF